MNHYDRLKQIAARLDRLRHVPTDVLAEIVERHDSCLRTHKPGDPPEVTGDRELAVQLCAECPAHDECLELEFRTAGTQTVGVWGGLTEEDRRNLYPLWRARRDDAEGGEPQ